MIDDAQGIVSIVELVLNVPSLILALIICARHGSSRSSGWIYTVLLCLVRMVGASCHLLTYSNSSTRLIKATLIIEEIGLSPLLLAALGLISRFIDWVNIGSAHTRLDVAHFRILQLLILLATVLCVVGGTSTKPGPDGASERAIAVSVALALPFTAIRLTFLVLVTFLHNDTFRLLHGSLGARIAMVPIPEHIVIDSWTFTVSIPPRK
ncbi:hypothetical protein B0H63DRAFT_540891 [Podospora didyma]|uniref:DUF7702 domain-containing protein n=1 Tax=Podospora didyma TaxID=330526 RepID=A0AAE0NSD7_9PEZI|nr:hypothetical protein B0H63DRAFT_540891 [Podospora didyma]